MLLALLLACTTKPLSADDTSTAPDGGSPTEGDAGTPTGGDGGSPTEGDAEPTEPTEPTEPVRRVRFVAMGDAGEGNTDQYLVGERIAEVCAAKDDEHGPGCEFVLYLGDNFYDDGVDDVDDSQFESKFELPYAGLDLPFMISSTPTTQRSGPCRTSTTASSGSTPRSSR